MKAQKAADGEDDYDEDGPSVLYGANTEDEYSAMQPDYLASDARGP